MGRSRGQGQPTKLTEETRKKAYEAAALGASVLELAFYVNVSRRTFYNWIKMDEAFAEEIDRLRQKPILKARQTIVKSLDDPSGAQWFLERKLKKEFSTRQEVTGEDGKAISVDLDLGKKIGDRLKDIL